MYVHTITVNTISFYSAFRTLGMHDQGNFHINSIVVRKRNKGGYCSTLLVLACDRRGILHPNREAYSPLHSKLRRSFVLNNTYIQTLEYSVVSFAFNCDCQMSICDTRAKPPIVERFYFRSGSLHQCSNSIKEAFRLRTQQNYQLATNIRRI